MTGNGYYRFPTIYQDRVVFVCEDDLWAVPASGGVAHRLTANLGMVSRPVASPDGQWLAFVGREDGESEVYVMPFEGGPSKRLTFLGGSTTVLGWTPDGQRIVFASSTSQPFRQLTPLYTIRPEVDPTESNLPEPLPFGPATAIAYGPAGQVVIGRRAIDSARWKRYRGGTAGDIWIDAKGNGTFKLLSKELTGNVTSPMWLDQRVYFLSDHEGIANIYSSTPTGRGLRRHTHHEDFYVRNPASDGRRIVYRAGADLYLLDPAAKREAAPHKIEVEWHSPQIQRNRRFVNPTSFIDHFALHPKGHSVTLTTRGKSFAMSNWEGAVIQLGEPQRARYRLTEWLNDGQRLLTLSDASGEETLEIHSNAINSPNNRQVERLEGLDIGRPLFLSVSPTADAVVFGNHRYELLHLDLKSKALTQLDKSRHHRILKAAWSPDGQWVAYNFSTSLSTSAIKLCHLPTGETHFVTAPHRTDDYGPSFDPGGKYLYFISRRDFSPVRDSHYFELSFPHGGRPYLVTLQKETPNPFIPLPNGAIAENGKEPERVEEKVTGKKGKKGKRKKQKGADPSQSSPPKPTFDIDLAGIQQRVIAFPVPEGRYYQIEGIPKNKVLFTSLPLESQVGGGDERAEQPKGLLELYDFNERRRDFILGGAYSFDLSRDRTVLGYFSNKRLRVLKAGEKPDNGATGCNRKSGWVDVNRAKVAVTPPDEWRQMFREAWRLQRDHFWSEDMSSVDWQLVYERYYPLVERVATRSEFSDLLWDMQGELGTSHAYELGGDYRPEPRYSQGFLGADFAFEAQSGGYRLTHIVTGDSWLEGVDSPLNRLGVNAQPGDVLLEIDGRRLGPTLSPGEALVNRANSEVQLTMLFQNRGDKKISKKTKKKQKAAKPQPIQTVLVKTLGDERRARYREWVEANRRRVHEETEGRVGYVHVPDMGTFGYAEFHRYYLAESEYEGLVVDVRFNGGGSVSQLLLEKLARRRIGYDKPRYGDPIPYPFHSVLGPIVALTNEYAGSDGDIFSHAFKILQLGPLIGKRTWGGVIGIWPRHSLVDGTTTTQPEFSQWFEDVGWEVENYGTDPDIEVEITPQDYAQGRDPQLARAIQEVLKLLKENPPQLPEFGPLPSRQLPKLPKLPAKPEK